MSSTLSFSQGESNLVNRIRNGDRKALLELFDRNRRPIVTLVTRNGGSSDDGEDVLQEAIVVLWEKIRSGEFEERAALSTFLYGVAKRLWLRRLDRKKRYASEDADPDMTASDDPGAEEELVREEEVDRVVRALSRLDGACRSLLLLFYWENLPMEDIAHLMGLANAQTAKAKKYQCKEKLRHLIQDTNDG